MKTKQIHFEKDNNWPATLANSIFSDLSIQVLNLQNEKYSSKELRSTSAQKGFIASIGIFTRSMGRKKKSIFFTNIYKLYLLRNSLSRKLYFPKELIDMYVKNVSEQERDNILVRDSTGWSEFIG